jgi:hypothetical protein
MDNDIVAIPLNNNKYAICQILDQRLPNSLRIALFNETIDSLEEYKLENLCKIKNLISLLEVTKEQINKRAWKIIGNKVTEVPTHIFPNEKFKPDNWIGSIVQEASIVDEFVNAYHGLSLWDDWFDPNYLDSLLYDKSKKPNNLLYKR